MINKPFLAFLFVLCLTFTSKAQNNAEDKTVTNVAILIYPGVYLLDFAGPQEVFFDSYSDDNKHLFNVYTVSLNNGELKAHCGTKITPDYDTLTCPTPDILVIPGGDLYLLTDQPKFREWLIRTADSAATVMSVCTGAFILADMGLLDNMSATTWHGALKSLKKINPSINVVEGVRYTDNGKIITTAGISAGIDGSLYVVAKYFGKHAADAAAAYMDYEYWE